MNGTKKTSFDTYLLLLLLQFRAKPIVIPMAIVMHTVYIDMVYGVFFCFSVLYCTSAHDCTFSNYRMIIFAHGCALLAICRDLL